MNKIKLAKNRTVNVCLIGTGYMGKCHALAWNAVAPTFGDVERPRLDLLVEADAASAERRAAQLGFARWTGDWKAAMADPAIDVVSITTPTGLHAEMAMAALEGGKHVWCEKPMSLDLKGSTGMEVSVRRSGLVTALGYNYIQNPAMRLIKTLLDDGEIGAVDHVRLEMDEDFMADTGSTLYASYSGPHAGSVLQEFGVHPLSLLHVTVGGMAEVLAEQWRRPAAAGDGAAVGIQHCNIAGALFRLQCGASGTLALSRSAWGRKGRLALQVFGSRGSITFDQERLNEVQLYTTAGKADRQGFRTILSGPEHPPYDAFVPSPGHGLGFNDLKVIECREFLKALHGEPAHLIDFEAGLTIETTIDAMLRSAETKRWITI